MDGPRVTGTSKHISSQGYESRWDWDIIDIIDKSLQ